MPIPQSLIRNALGLAFGGKILAQPCPDTPSAPPKTLPAYY